MRSYARADKLIRLGAKLTAEGAPEAQQVLERAVAIAPEDPDILVRAASLSWDNDQCDRARELLARARDRAPADFDLASTMDYLDGLLAKHDGRRGDAIELLYAAFDADPWQRSFGYQLGIELLRAGRVSQARFVAERALERGAEDEDLPRLCDQLGEIIAAETAYAGPADPTTSRDLARALHVFDPDRAREVLAASLHANDGRQRADLAFDLGVLLMEEDPDVARGYFDEVLALVTEDAVMRSAAAFNLGTLCWTSNPAEARRMFELACESLAPELAKLARESLEQLG